ncbi:hypothetical protein GCM10023405_31490 [Streptomonospora salina]
MPIVTLDSDLPLGAGSDLVRLLRKVDNPYAGSPDPRAAFRTMPVNAGISKTLLTVLGTSAIRKPEGVPQAVVIAVPHPAGGPPHLLVASIPASGADHLRTLMRAGRKEGFVTEVPPEKVAADTPVEWWRVSDDRAEVTTRRDWSRPVAAFSGKTVHIWGCGGLGSWVADYVVRAGAKEVTLCDPGSITTGLLVRQNFTEADVGNAKVEALARRLRAINDTVKVSVHGTVIPDELDLTAVDLIIDATVSIAISRVLDSVAAGLGRPALAQMATDARTGTLGIMSVSMPNLTGGPLSIDRQAGKRVLSDGTLEAFHDLWNTSEMNAEIIPTRGCSTPTFHGSAADLAGVAASLTSILGSHIGAVTPVSGTHLISLPHGEAGPLRTFLPAE